LEAIPHLEAAVRLGPHDLLLWAFYNLRGNCRLFLKQFGQAITDYNLAI